MPKNGLLSSKAKKNCLLSPARVLHSSRCTVIALGPKGRIKKFSKKDSSAKGKPCVLKPIINITSFEGWQSGRWRFLRVKECLESYADTNLVLVAVIAMPVELKACNAIVRLSKFFASMETVQNVILCSVCNLKMIIEQSCLH